MELAKATAAAFFSKRFEAEPYDALKAARWARTDVIE